MSLCFNWSCDFQRFTKSKKLSKFQVRTTTLFILNKSLSTSLFNLQGAICCNKHFIELFQALNRSSNSLFSISKLEPFVKNFFRFIFQTRSRSHDKLFSFAPPSRDSFNRIPNLGGKVKHYFHFLRYFSLCTCINTAHCRTIFVLIILYLSKTTENLDISRLLLYNFAFVKTILNKEHCS